MEREILLKIILFYFCVQRTRANTGDNDNESINITTDRSDIATTQSYRLSRAYRRGNYEDDHDHDHDEENDEMQDMKAMAEAKSEYWGGYYDFLINEGSYKFWAVFQLATAALLIYSGFAALYYAKVNPATTDDYEDDFFRRKRRAVPTLFHIDTTTFQRIIDAIEDY